MPSRRRRRRKRRATRGGRVTIPLPKSNGEWKRPCSARKRVLTSDFSDIAFTGAMAGGSVPRASVGAAASLPGDLPHLVEHEVADPLAAVAQKPHRSGIDEIGEQDAVARFDLGPDR